MEECGSTSSDTAVPVSIVVKVQARLRNIDGKCPQFGIEATTNQSRLIAFKSGCAGIQG